MKLKPYKINDGVFAVTKDDGSAHGYPLHLNEIEAEQACARANGFYPLLAEHALLTRKEKATQELLESSENERMRIARDWQKAEIEIANVLTENRRLKNRVGNYFVAGMLVSAGLFLAQHFFF